MEKDINNQEIEEEKYDGSDVIGPFDSNAIDVDISVVNLGSLLEQLEYQEIDLKPEFQRASNVWDVVRKSRLIESVLLGLPLPSFYFSEDPETNKLIVVDGLQRLCAFMDFCISKTLRLEGMQFLQYLEGKCYDDLDRTQVRRIRSLKITLNTLRKKTPQRVKFVIFQRVNTAGIPLTPQEMRNALYQKKATDLLREMVSLRSFTLATGGISIKRMLDCDFANRFVAFFLCKKDYDGDLDKFMGDALEKVNKMTDKNIEVVCDSFDKSMKTCYELLGSNAFKRPNPRKSGSFLKINKAIFDVLSVTMAKLTDDERKKLIQHKKSFRTTFYSLFLDNDFLSSITSGTAKVPQVEIRFNKLNNLINQILNDDK